MSENLADTTANLGGQPSMPGPPPVTQPIAHSPQVRLGPYRLLQRLGEGGMGVVHLALDERGRAVAIKVLRDHIAHDPDARARLAREVTSLRRVDHLLVAPIIDADVDGSRPYLVTRYVPAPSLDAWVRSHGPVQGPGLVRLATGLSDALRAIHAAGVIHRDLKPGNVLLHDDSPVLIDFGIAHIADDTRLTSTGLIMGTPGYLSPELLGGGEVTEATDWWGWAATIAFAAQGKPPFGAGPVDAVVHRVRAGECDLTGVDPRLSPLLAAALHPDASRRPPQPTIVAALRSYVAGGDTTQALPTVEPAGASGAATVTLMTGSGRVSGPVSRGSDEASTRLQPVAPTSPMPTAAEPPHVPPYARFTAPALFPPVAPAHVPPAQPPAASWSAPPVVPSPEVPGGTGDGAVPMPGRDGLSPNSAQQAPLSADPWVRPSTPGGEGAADAGSGRVGAGQVAGRSSWGAAIGRAPAVRPPSVPGERDRVAYSDPRIGRSQRTGTVVAGVTAMAALAANAPAIALMVGLAWGALARVSDRTVTSLTIKRFERGARGGDVPVAVLLSPVRLLVAIVTSVLSTILPLVVGVAGAFTVALLEGSLGTGRQGVNGPLPLAAGALVTAGLAWWGAGGTSVRRGTRSVIRGIAPGRLGSVVVTTLLLLAAGYLAIRTQASHFDVSWWPGTAPSFEWATRWF